MAGLIDQAETRQATLDFVNALLGTVEDVRKALFVESIDTIIEREKLEHGPDTGFAMACAMGVVQFRVKSAERHVNSMRTVLTDFRADLEAAKRAEAAS